MIPPSKSFCVGFYVDLTQQQRHQKTTPTNQKKQKQHVGLGKYPIGHHINCKYRDIYPQNTNYWHVRHRFRWVSLQECFHVGGSAEAWCNKLVSCWHLPKFRIDLLLVMVVVVDDYYYDDDDVVDVDVDDADVGVCWCCHYLDYAGPFKKGETTIVSSMIL